MPERPRGGLVVQHPEDGRWGVLVPGNAEGTDGAIVSLGWFTQDRWLLDRTWCKPHEGCRLCDHLRAHEFNPEAALVEAIRMPGGYGFFHVKTAPHA